MFKAVILGTILVTVVAVSEARASLDSSSCTLIGSLSKTIMTNRQNGVMMDTVMSVLRDNDPVTAYIRKIVIEAYKENLYTSDLVRERVITEFANKNMQICYEELK